MVRGCDLYVDKLAELNAPALRQREERPPSCKLLERKGACNLDCAGALLRAHRYPAVWEPDALVHGAPPLVLFSLYAGVVQHVDHVQLLAGRLQLIPVRARVPLDLLALDGPPEEGQVTRALQHKKPLFRIPDPNDQMATAQQSRHHRLLLGLWHGHQRQRCLQPQELCYREVLRARRRMVP
eukprot:3928516-Pyramimonas_sp.AAC.2